MAVFPTAIATDVDLYIAVNNKSTVLADNPLSAVAVTVNVSSTAGFPDVGIVTIDLEAIRYTGKTATSFTGCTRGFDGTTAASHTAGVTVFHDIPAAHHNAPKDEIIAIETFLDEHIGKGTAVLAEEFEYLSGVTSSIQDQFDDVQTDLGVIVTALAGKEPTITQLPIAKGGTNSVAALSNNRVIRSNGGAIVEAAAITAARALVSDADGIPTHSAVTSAELAHLSGVTSAIQTQLNAKAVDSAVVHNTGNEAVAGVKTFSSAPVVPAIGGVTPAVNSIYSDSLVKGWINFDGSGTISIRDRYNVTSITDHGTGDYTVTWDRDFASSNYCAQVTCHYPGYPAINNSGSLAAGTTRVFIQNTSGSGVDVTLVSVLAIGGQ